MWLQDPQRLLDRDEQDKDLCTLWIDFQQERVRMKGVPDSSKEILRNFSNSLWERFLKCILNFKSPRVDILIKYNKSKLVEKCNEKTGSDIKLLIILP